MIDLTPLEVRKKKGDFRKAMRGYEPQAVDDFLDLVADRLEQLVRENASLQERVTSVGSQVSDYRERERALTEALVTAQEMREQMRQQIEREVELKRREAEADAENVRTAAAQLREREEENIRRLRARQTQFVQSYRSFLERELAEIGVMVQTLNLMSDEPAPPPARKRSKKIEAPAPEPQAQSEPVPEPEPEPEAEAVAMLDVAMLNEFPDADVPAEEVEAETEAAPDEAEAGMEAAALPDMVVQEELIDLSLHLPPPEEEADELELIDEMVDDEGDDVDSKNDEDDTGGWVSTLLEGKGD